MDPKESAPQKYIRTFAGDMEILQKGGRPDLTPMPQAQEAPVEVQPPAPPPTTPTPPPGFIPEAVAIPTQTQQARPSDRLVEASPIAEAPAPSAPPVIKNEVAKAPVATGPTPIHTYTGDFEDRLSKTGASTTVVLAAEGDAPRTSVATSEAPKRNWITVAVSSVLVLVGIAALYVAYTYYTSSQPVAPIAVPATPIFVDERQMVTGTGADLAKQIASASTKPLSSGHVRLLYAQSSATNISPVIFLALGLPAPDILLRNIAATNNAAGIVSASGNEFPFFILSVSSYSDTFSGMLTWEPSMPKDLGGFFPAYPLASSTTAAISSVPVSTTQPGFYDMVVANHDTRTYKDAFGRSVLLYGYFNPTTLIIARDASTFTELVNRLANSHTVQ